jgi:hypothetical protein
MTALPTEPDLMPRERPEPTPPPCERWRVVWRQGLAPLLSTPELVVLRDALAGDDPALLQGMTSQPPALKVCGDFAPEGACLLGYAGWRGLGLATVGEVEAYFGFLCYECDRHLNDLKASCEFLNVYDGWPRDRMRFELLPEVEAEMARRDV